MTISFSRKTLLHDVSSRGPETFSSPDLNTYSFYNSPQTLMITDAEFRWMWKNSWPIKGTISTPTTMDQESQDPTEVCGDQMLLYTNHPTDMCIEHSPERGYWSMHIAWQCCGIASVLALKQVHYMYIVRVALISWMQSSKKQCSTLKSSVMICVHTPLTCMTIFISVKCPM
jgi:hypothetical protein